MKRLLYLIFVFGLASSAMSQNYHTAVGIKGGYPGFGALNLKHFTNSNNALEVSVGGGRSYLWIQGLYEWNMELPTSGLNWYVGVGPNIGLATGSAFYLGATGLAGIEYTFSDLPINVALDTGPALSVLPGITFGWGGGLAVRYTLR